MASHNHLFTSESVTEGHPDKVADQISDAILDTVIAEDPRGRVACETLVTTGLAIVAGEITTSCYADIPKVVRQTIEEIGYTDASFGFDYETCAVVTSIDEQSTDIAKGVNEAEDHEQGAGDQGMMFGYASNETPELMPMPILLAHKITRRLSIVRKEGILPFLRPDGKSQVTVEYADGKPVRVDTVVVAAQHSPDVDMDHLRKEIIDKVILPVMPEGFVDSKRIQYHINSTGRFVRGGPQADCGLTGRKIIVDTYGGVGSHGGGCFSGKDPSKVDRSGSYMARHIAKNVVAARIADQCEIQIAYTIGVAEPVSVMIDTQGTGKMSDEDTANMVREAFDLHPAKIIRYLDLLKPIFKRTAAYGHFGREEEGFTWEKTNMADELRRAANI